MSYMSDSEWDRIFKRDEPFITRRAIMPPPVDEDKLKREAEAGRELMKELQCSEAPWPLHRQTLTSHHGPSPSPLQAPPWARSSRSTSAPTP